MSEVTWYIAVAAACLITVSNWRVGVVLAVVVDALRDPVRKLIEDEPIGVTLSGAALWLVVTFIAVLQERDEFRRITSRYPRTKTFLVCVAVALLPAAVISAALYPGGYKLAIVGLMSYLAPLCGVGAGYLFARSEREIYRLFSVYALLNGVLLTGTFMEYSGLDYPGLGGLEGAEWIRYRTGYTVDLICGYYRSPDVMGLHAAHVLMFSMMMAVRTGAVGRYGWAALVIWAAVALMLCGRRKMIGIPFVFLAAFLLIGTARGLKKLNATLGLTAAMLLLGTATTLVVLDDNESREYAQYAGTTLTEGAGRANGLVVNSTIYTLRSAGILGAGLGTATQGRAYVNVRTSRAARGWQEDGVSRMFLEFGVPGVLLLLVAGWQGALSLRDSLRIVPPTSSVQTLQVAVLSILTANAASFAVSHQIFSGDPAGALLAAIMPGISLGAPRIYAASRPQPQRLPQMAVGPVTGVPASGGVPAS